MQFHRAVDQTRAGHARAELGNGLARGLAHLEVRRQPQVVVRAEHRDPAPLEDRLGSVVQVERAKERVHAHLASVVGRAKLEGLLEDVASADGRQRRARRHRSGKLGFRSAIRLGCVAVRVSSAVDLRNLGVAVAVRPVAVLAGLDRDPRFGQVDVVGDGRVDRGKAVPLDEKLPRFAGLLGGSAHPGAGVHDSLGRPHHAVVAQHPEDARRHG